MPLSAGDSLGPYQIRSLIGAGGMGEVYRAHDPRLGRDVAIKVSAQQFSDRFEREARAIAALNHPHICQVYDTGPNYLVMEFIDGVPVAGPLPVDLALRYAVQIADALSAAHAKGITHRDLKPANILVTAAGLKLLDFGLASLTERSAADETAVMGLTNAATILGTPAYMSPEQAEGKPVDARSDIFSFGLVLYEMLTGRRAFTGDSAIAIMAAIVRDTPGPMNVPPAIEAIVTRCLCKSPASRFPSMSQAKDALLSANSDVSTTVSATLLAQPQSSIAVLPFTNLGGDKENEYFGDGLAEEIINFLAQIPGLKVTARTSAFAFKGKAKDIRKIADQLGVATILEGSVRRSGSRIRMTAQLINAQDGYHLWSQRYDREVADLFDLQDEIAQAIVSALRVTLSRATTPSEQYKPSPPAYEALLKARHYQRTAVPELRRRAKECYEQAIALDPKFALAQCEFGIYFLSLTAAGALSPKQALPIVRSQAEKALELDPLLPEGEAMLGVVASSLDYDWKESARRFGLAMARDPVPVNVRFQYALAYLLRVGRPLEALQQLQLGLQEDPLNPLLQINRAGCLVAAGRDEQAAEAYREALELNPGIVGALGPLASYHASRDEMDQALEFCERAYAVAPLLPHVIGLRAGLMKRTGATRQAGELLASLRPGDAFGAPRGLAVYHWVLREFDAEADWLGKAIEQRDAYSAGYLRLWYGRELRSTPRWAELMRKLNLPESC